MAFTQLETPEGRPHKNLQRLTVAANRLMSGLISGPVSVFGLRICTRHFRSRRTVGQKSVSSEEPWYQHLLVISTHQQIQQVEEH